jgi:organic radical activating enzyme
MFDLNNYYSSARSGNRIDNSEVIAFIKSYEHIVLWGASYLGKAVADYLTTQNIIDFIWWDARADEIGEVDGRKILAPFTGNSAEDCSHTIVIFCIGNTAIMGNLLSRLYEKGYHDVVRGDFLFMGAVCPFDVTTGIDGRICNGRMTCRSMFCERLQNIIKLRNDKGGLHFENLTFMITTNCSLKCKYCCAYMNSYSPEKRQFFSYEQICEDIDRIFDTVDSVGSITIQGGEPFLHPDIDKIVEKLLSKKNFGIVSIATNGIFHIKEEKLAVFRDNRLNVAFSGYYDALSDDLLDLYYKNIEMMKQNEIPHTVGVRMPEWTIPPTLWNRHFSEEVMRQKKENCKIPTRCMQVMNGRLYPCLYSVSLHGIGVADYPCDYVELATEDLKGHIVDFMNRPYYNSCGHCGGTGGTTPMAGEQGFYDFMTEGGL